MRSRLTIKEERGFTLSEVMVVVAIVSILASISIVSYAVFANKAKTVEAETALREVNRLETLYYEARGQFSSDLETIGYASTSLKYYTVSVQVTPDSRDVSYKATATPIGNTYHEPWVLTRYQNGSIMLEKLTAIPMTTTDVTVSTSDNTDPGGRSSGSTGAGASGGPSSRGPGTVNQSVIGSSTNGSSIGSGNQSANSVGPSSRGGQ